MDLETQLNSLPYISQDFLGIGGIIKAQPGDFCVEEIPLYPPAGQGKHIYINLTRELWNTHDLVKRLEGMFGLRTGEVGVAGLKDKHARATQTFSLHSPTGDAQKIADHMESELSVSINWVTRHRNRLKRGHLLGNRFQILIRNPHTDGLERAQAIARFLKHVYVPNFYGEQRLGKNYKNALQGLRVFRGKKKCAPWLRDFLLSAYQSALFNIWLKERMERDQFTLISVGDVASKKGSGGLFIVDDECLEQSRLDVGEITYTGPIFGYKMKNAVGVPGECEQELAIRAGLSPKLLKRARLKGSRRTGRFELENLGILKNSQGIEVSFSLPKGAYATTVLREIMKSTSNLKM